MQATTGSTDATSARGGAVTLQPAPHARGRIWTARILTALVAVFMLVDGVLRVAGFAPYVEGTVKYGYPEHFATWIGLTLIAFTILYVLPRTAVLGAVLVTGYLGGAVASHLRVGESFIFPLAFAVMLWTALYLRDGRLGRLLIDPR